MLINFLVDTAQAVALPTFGGGQDLPAFISSVYSFALTVVGIAVFVRILYAGFLWLTAAGNASKAGDAKNKIQSAVIGAILLFAAYLILYIINPDLVKNTFNFNIPKSETVSFGTDAVATSTTNGNGVINGVPGQTGTSGFNWWLPSVRAQGIHFFTIKVVDANGNSFERDYSMEILPDVSAQNMDANKAVSRERFYPAVGVNDVVHAAGGELAIITPFVSDGVVNRPYFAEIVVSGGQAPYIYSVSGGSLPDGLALQTVLEMPIFRIDNLTSQRNPSYIYYVGDRWRLTLSNAAPNAAVYIKWQKNGGSWFYPGLTPDANGWTVYGTTDTNGRWVNEANFSSSELGNWHEWAKVGGQISNVIGFEVVALPVGATGSQPSTGSCASGTIWTGHMDASGNPICTVDGQLGSSGSSVGTGGGAALEGACQGFGTGPGEIDLTSEWGNCLSDANSISPSSLPLCGSAGAQVGDACLYLGTTVSGQPTQTIRCTYQDQAQAIRCGAPGSGEYCLLGYAPPGCIWQ